jgi:hypothetical protein
MPHRVPPIARIRLSRSLPRLLALPVIGLVVGFAAAAGGPLLWPGAIGLVVGGAGAVAAALAVVGALVSLSVRLEVEEAAVRVSWLGGERTYGLVPGPVTRVRLRGERASRLTGGRRMLGGQLGAAHLRDEEDIEVVRLAPTPTAILVPTDRGRLAIAATDESALLEALSRAARARQRLEELVIAAPPLDAPAAPVAQPVVEVDPVLMTGIERALFERRMAEERAAAEAAATAERAAAEAAPIAAAEAGAAAADAAVTAAPRRRGRLRRGLGRPLARPRPSAVLVLLPLIGTGAAWGAALLLDRMPDPGSDLGRLTALALVLAGPAASIGAIMARIWWPRLVGVVVAGGLAATVFVGRSLIGG